MGFLRRLLRVVGQHLETMGRERPEPDKVYDRAYDQRAPQVDDHCYEFRPGPAEGNCQTDGHYLCVGCALMDPRVAYYREHGDWPPDDEEPPPLDSPRAT